MSDSLRSLRTNERIARFFEQIVHFLIHSQKMSDSLKKIRKNRIFLRFYSFLSFLKKQKIRSFLLSEVSELLRSLRTNERP